MKCSIYGLLIVCLFVNSCAKKSPDVPVATMPARWEISPANKSILVGETALFHATFYNQFGEQSPTPATAAWSSSDNSIATISPQGLATGIRPGQVEIKIQYQSTVATALLTVAANSLQTATINVASPVEIGLNGSKSLTAIAKNANGDILAGKTFTWLSNNSTIASIETGTGKLTGNSYGTTTVTASADGIISNPAKVQVIRSGTFMGMSSKGTGKLQLDGSVLSLETSMDFSVQTGPPDLRMYLSNNSGNVTDAVEVATLNNRSGAQTWVVPGNTSITRYKFIVVWCKQFGGAYGVAEFTN